MLEIEEWRTLDGKYFPLRIEIISRHDIHTCKRSVYSGVLTQPKSDALIHEHANSIQIDLGLNCWFFSPKAIALTTVPPCCPWFAPQIRKPANIDHLNHILNISDVTQRCRNRTLNCTFTPGFLLIFWIKQPPTVEKKYKIKTLQAVEVGIPGGGKGRWIRLQRRQTSMVSGNKAPLKVNSSETPLSS